MNIKDKLYNNISDYTTIDFLYKLCEPHKHETTGRKLRELTQNGLIEPVKRQGCIIAYKRLDNQKAINTQPTTKNLHTRQIEAKKGDTEEDLNIKLSRICLFGRKDVLMALKSKNLIFKKGVIKKYDTTR
jgi:hypothetical protein